MLLNFLDSFSTLPSCFYTKMLPEAFSISPFLIHANPQAAVLIGLPVSSFMDSDFPAYFSGNTPLPGSESLAMVYAGHQFGYYAGQLGDGRAILLGQIKNNLGELWDVQLKGAGKTPYSRFGDGRAVLRSCIREYLCSEAMFGLGIPTTRALCIVGTDEQVHRETLEPGAILTRLSPSHIRFGHFEHFFYTGQHEAVKQLADYVMGLHFPEYVDMPNGYELFFSEVVKRTAHLIAMWQSVGFSHGVMNTDNMSILGLTMDYGPFGFMERFDPGFICNHSDAEARYAFDKQPLTGLWNLHALAHALQPLISWDASEIILKGYEGYLNTHFEFLMMNKLGILSPQKQDVALLHGLLKVMASQGADYTLSFWRLSETFVDPESWLGLFRDRDAALVWLAQYHDCIRQDDVDIDDVVSLMKRSNPKFVLRNWVAEAAIRDAEDKQDYGLLHVILNIVHSPFEQHSDFEYFAKPSPDSACKPISCSS